MKHVKTHAIRAVHFVKGTNDGELTCDCGASMLASQYNEHRRKAGLANGLISDLRRLHRDREMPSVWRKVVA